MDTALLASKLASCPILKTKLVSKMWKCGSGNEHCFKKRNWLHALKRKQNWYLKYSCVDPEMNNISVNCNKFAS